MRVLITGGVGFIGSNLARFHLERGDEVWLYDNFSRTGTERNLEWLREAPSGRLETVRGDMRDRTAVESVVSPGLERIYHLAGQVAVTLSIANPRADFEANALGTFNLLEAVRRHAPAAALVYASTNKVYGDLPGAQVVETETRYDYADFPEGISEEHPVDFYSPYGCSKGCGDQYVRDYARIYGLKTVVFRQSCIYGPRQFGVEDQGWVAHFCIAARRRQPIRIFGNGKQVRDLLWIGDLVEAYDRACRHIHAAAGQVFNIGGGRSRSLSIWHEYRPVLERLAGVPLPFERKPWRPGDQKVYYSDTRKAANILGWKPRVTVEEGLGRLWQWIGEHEDLFYV